MYVQQGRSLLAALLAVLAGAAGCQLLPTEAESACAACEQPFEVHVNNHFENDRVRVEIDGQVVFEERVTTDYVWSLAEVIRLERPVGTHRIRVVVNGTAEGRRTFALDRPLYLHVRYHPEAMPDLGIPQGVLIEVSERRPMYD